METTEKIVEAYIRYVKGWFTIPNIKCGGQLEIDLLAINVANRIRRYHIETSISISGVFSRLTTNPFSTSDLKDRVKQANQCRTLGYFKERKFGDERVLEKLKIFGFEPDNYTKVIVSMGWEKDVPEAAKKAKIELWDFKEILLEIANQCRSNPTYFTDDTMRTLQLMSMAMRS